MADLPDGTILRYVEAKSSHGVTLSIEQFIEWKVLVPVEFDYEAAIQLAISEIESGVVYEQDEYEARMAQLVRSMVKAALEIEGDDE